MDNYTVAECIDAATFLAGKAQRLAETGFPQESNVIATLSIAWSNLAIAKTQFDK